MSKIVPQSDLRLVNGRLLRIRRVVLIGRTAAVTYACHLLGVTTDGQMSHCLLASSGSVASGSVSSPGSFTALLRPPADLGPAFTPDNSQTLGRGFESL